MIYHCLHDLPHMKKIAPSIMIVMYNLIHLIDTISVTGASLRLDTSNSNGVKTIVPIRPIACLSGILDLGETVVRFFWMGFGLGGWKLLKHKCLEYLQPTFQCQTHYASHEPWVSQVTKSWADALTVVACCQAKPVLLFSPCILQSLDCRVTPPKHFLKQLVLDI